MEDHDIRRMNYINSIVCGHLLMIALLVLLVLQQGAAWRGGVVMWFMAYGASWLASGLSSTRKDKAALFFGVLCILFALAALGALLYGTPG